MGDKAPHGAAASAAGGDGEFAASEAQFRPRQSVSLLLSSFLSVPPAVHAVAVAGE
jgi:hypothetical protein